MNFKKNYFLILYIITLPLSIKVKANIKPVQFPKNIGKTHFIAGFDHTQLLTEENKKKDNAFKKNKALFAPKDDLCKKLCKLIAQEKSHIRIAIYTLTDKKITDELEKAFARGVAIDIITDQSTVLERYSKITDLATKGINVMVHNAGDTKKRGIMHNKFAIFSLNKNSQPSLWHGTFNFTRSGYTCNCESVIITFEPDLIAQFQNEFERIKNESKKYVAPFIIHS